MMIWVGVEWEQRVTHLDPGSVGRKQWESGLVPLDDTFIITECKGLLYITDYMGLFYIRDYIGLFYIRDYMILLYITEFMRLF